MLNNIRENKRTKILVLSLLLVLTVTIVGTIAYLTSKSDDVVNTMEPGRVTTEVWEEFDGKVKKNVNVKNTGNVPAYLRVALVSYRIKIDENGDPIDGNKEIEGTQPIIIGGKTLVDFKPGEGWFKYGNHYYYKHPVDPGKFPGNLDYENSIPLISEIELDNYTVKYNAEGNIIENSFNMDEGAQSVEVISEAIQAMGVVTDGLNKGTPAVTDAWGLEVDPITKALIDPNETK